MDFSALLPGPFATLAMADLGADVVKVEPPGGDGARTILKSLFRNANRNKRSLVVDLKNARASSVIEPLVRSADVVMEAFRPGAAARLGIDYGRLAAMNPRLVYCSLSGYGQTGPDRLRPGHDVNYLARSGALSLSGHWGEAPRRSGLPIADVAGGGFAVIAILSALHDRQRSGQGVYLDLSIVEAAMSLAVLRHGADFDARSQPHVRPTNDLFETADGRWIALGVVEQQFWSKFVEVIANLAPDLLDERYGSIDKRHRDGDVVSARIRSVIRMRDAAYWMPLFERHDVPAELVVSPAVATRTAQAVDRETIAELGGERHLPFPVHAAGRRGAALRSLAPALGAHTDEVLVSLGFDAGQIAELRSAGTVA